MPLAGHLAFSALLALFPFLIFMATLAGYLGDALTSSRLVELLFQFFPPDVADALEAPLLSVVENRRGGLATISIVLAVWVASNGVEALRVGLNAAYGVDEPHALWVARLQSLAFVFGGAAIVFVLAFTVVLGPLIWQVLDRLFADTGIAVRFVWIAIRYAVALLLFMAGLLALHHWLPKRKVRIRLLVPGILLTTALWVLAATVFSLYLGSFADYSLLYGSLGGVIITLIFFYISGFVFLYGANFNFVRLERKLERLRRRTQEGARESGV
jgi:membrane protein